MNDYQDGNPEGWGSIKKPQEQYDEETRNNYIDHMLKLPFGEYFSRETLTYDMPQEKIKEFSTHTRYIPVVNVNITLNKSCIPVDTRSPVGFFLGAMVYCSG